MLFDKASPSVSGAGRNTAYTTSRSDVVQLVPQTALQILDVGCSNGALGSALKGMVPNRSVCGIELDSDFAAVAANHLDYVVNADVNLLNWSEALVGRHFDCIIFADVLEHLIDPHYCLNQALQFLQSGGSIVVSLPNIRHLSALWSIFYRGHFPKRDRGIFDRTHLRWFTLCDAYKLFTDSGLEISAVSQALRWGDSGGGRMNRLLNRLPQTVKKWSPVREFLTYQICLRGEMVS